KVTDPFPRSTRCQRVPARARTTTSPHGAIPRERTVTAPTERLMALTWSYCILSAERFTGAPRLLLPSVHGRRMTNGVSASGPAGSPKVPRLNSCGVTPGDRSTLRSSTAKFLKLESKPSPSRVRYSSMIESMAAALLDLAELSAVHMRKTALALFAV